MGIIDAMVLLVKMIIILLISLPQLLLTFIQLFNPISVLNDTITGVILSVKIILTNVIGFFKSKDGGYDKCNDTGSGLFGFRRNRNKEGKIISESGGDCGGDKTCRKSYLFKYLVTIICPPSALFLHMGAYGWFHVIISLYSQCISITSWSYLRITTCHLFCIKNKL